MSEPRDAGDFSTPLGAPTVEQLTSLVFELALQLHQERMHRIALEASLEAAALLDLNATDRSMSNPTVIERGQAALNKSMSGIMRIMTENSDPRTPMRPLEEKSVK